MFAEGGIEWYLRVEQEPTLRLILQHRKGGTDVEHARAGEGEHLDLPDLGCTIEVSALRRRG